MESGFGALCKLQALRAHKASRASKHIQGHVMTLTVTSVTAAWQLWALSHVRHKHWGALACRHSCGTDYVAVHSILRSKAQLIAMQTVTKRTLPTYLHM